MTFIADTMIFEPERSSPDFSENRYTYDHIRQLRVELESLARGYPICPNAISLIRQRCAHLRTPTTGAVSAPLTAAAVQQPNHLHRLPRRWSPTPPAVRPPRRRPTSTATFTTERRRGGFRLQPHPRMSSQSRAGIESPRVRGSFCRRMGTFAGYSRPIRHAPNPFTGESIAIAAPRAPLSKADTTHLGVVNLRLPKQAIPVPNTSAAHSK